MAILQEANLLQVNRTRARLLVSRMFGLGILILLVLGSSYWSSAPLFDQALFIIGFFLAILGFCGRLWCLSYIAGRKKKVLVTEGPYSLCRHPLYFFSLVGGSGLGLCTETLSAPLLFAFAFAMYYPHIIRTEERFLSTNFSDYESYRKRVPLFFPSWSNFTEGHGVIHAADFRKEILGTGAFLSCIGAFELIEALHHIDVLPTYFLIP